MADLAQTIDPWRLILHQSMSCPVLHQMVTRVHRGDLTREDALMACVLFLSQERRRFMDMEVDRLKKEPQSGVTRRADL